MGPVTAPVYMYIVTLPVHTEVYLKVFNIFSFLICIFVFYLCSDSLLSTDSSASLIEISILTDVKITPTLIFYPLVHNMTN